MNANENLHAVFKQMIQKKETHIQYLNKQIPPLINLFKLRTLSSIL